MNNNIHAVICMLNSKYIHSSLAPWYLLAGVAAFCGEGISAEVVEGTVNQEPDVLIDAVIAKKPAVIGFCCYIWNITLIKKLLPRIKAALPETVIVLGGPEVSYNAGDILAAEPLVDFVIAGEGEKPLALLLNSLSESGSAAGVMAAGVMAAGGHIGPPLRDDGQKDGFDDIPGLCYRWDGTAVIQPPHCTAEEPPDPYGAAYFDALKGRIAYLETSRGCPFSCAFCLSGTGQSVRWFSLERAKKDMIRLANSGTQTVKFVDRTFNADKARAREIFRFIADNHGQAIPGGVCFHFEIAGDLLDEDTLEMLAEMPKGAIQFEIGLQSFNDTTLSAICRKTDVNRLKNNIRCLVELGNIHIHIDLIAGLPYEDITSFADSFNTAYSLRPHMLQLGFLKLLHGAVMRENPGIFPCRYAPEPPYEVNETPWLPPEDLCKQHEAADALGRLYNSGRFKRTLDYVLAQSRMTPFDLYCDAGRLLGTQGSVSLDALTSLMLDHFKNLPGIDAEILRDQMVRDRLAVNASGKLPAVLRHQKAPRQLTNSRRGAAVLASEKVVVIADYSKKNPVTGEYDLKDIILS